MNDLPKRREASVFDFSADYVFLHPDPKLQYYDQTTATSGPKPMYMEAQESQ